MFARLLLSASAAVLFAAAGLVETPAGRALSVDEAWATTGGQVTPGEPEPGPTIDLEELCCGKVSGCQIPSSPSYLQYECKYMGSRQGCNNNYYEPGTGDGEKCRVSGSGESSGEWCSDVGPKVVCMTIYECLLVDGVCTQTKLPDDDQPAKAPTSCDGTDCT